MSSIFTAASARAIGVVALLGIVATTVRAEPITLTNVPAYNWYHGCGPTALGSIFGYYDLRGYDNLFDASGWDAVKLTANVQDHLTSPEHIAKYNPTPDNSSLPVPAFTSIADWLRTSVDPNEYGASQRTYADDALLGYSAYRGYEGATVSNLTYAINFSWLSLTSEIDAGRPLVLFVDSDGNGTSDHIVPVLGYDDRGAGGKYYGCYTTWTENESVAWYEFRGMSSSWSWGVGYAATFSMPTAVPEPGGALMTCSALASICLLCLPPLRKRARERSHSLTATACYLAWQGVSLGIGCLN